MAVLVRWLCRLYRALLYAYPRDFRRRYGREMAQVFDARCRSVAQTRGVGGLLLFGAQTAADWLTTSINERACPIQPAQSVPMFYIHGSDRPGTGALIHGGVLSIGVFSLISLLIGLGGGRRAPIVGSHHPSRSHVLEARSTAEPADLPAEIRVKPYPDKPPRSPYFRLLAVLGALDPDEDNIISASEIAGAAAALKKLDKDRDGRLSAQECGSDKTAGLSLMRVFMRVHPVHAALDADHDGQISADEIRNAPAALKTLDANHDGALTEDELLPDPVTSRVASVLFALDTNGDGRISASERSGEVGRRFRALLDAADRDRDGVVTEEELTIAVLSAGR